MGLRNLDKNVLDQVGHGLDEKHLAKCYTGHNIIGQIHVGQKYFGQANTGQKYLCFPHCMLIGTKLNPGET